MQTNPEAKVDPAGTGTEPVTPVVATSVATSVEIKGVKEKDIEGSTAAGAERDA